MRISQPWCLMMIASPTPTAMALRALSSAFVHNVILSADALVTLTRCSRPIFCTTRSWRFKRPRMPLANSFYPSFIQVFQIVADAHAARPAPATLGLLSCQLCTHSCTTFFVSSKRQLRIRSRLCSPFPVIRVCVRHLGSFPNHMPPVFMSGFIHFCDAVGFNDACEIQPLQIRLGAQTRIHHDRDNRCRDPPPASWARSTVKVSASQCRRFRSSIARSIPGGTAPNHHALTSRHRPSVTTATP